MTSENSARADNWMNMTRPDTITNIDETGYHESALMAREAARLSEANAMLRRRAAFWRWVALSGYGLAALVLIVLLRVMEGR